MAYEFFVALRYLRSRRMQGFVSAISLISVLGVTVGVAALIIAQAMMTGFYQEIQAKIMAGNPDLLVWNQKPGGRLDDPGKVMDILQGLPGVRATAPVVMGNGLAIGVGGREPLGVEIFGVMPDLERKLTSVSGNMVQGRWEDLTAQGNGIVVGSELAESLGVQVGDAVRLVIPQVRVSPLTPPLVRNRMFRVRGIFSLDFYQWDASRVYMHIDQAQTFLSRGRGKGPTAMELGAVSVESIPRLRRAAARALGSAYFVGDVMNRNADFFKALRTEKIWMFLAIGLIVVVACLNIVSTLILMVMDKIRAIGALVALGARVRSIVAVFMLQGLIIGLVGTLSGSLLGTFTCWILESRRLIRLSPDVYFISHVPFRTGPGDVALAAGLAMTVAFVATLYPAMKAARLDPVQALRHE